MKRPLTLLALPIVLAALAFAAFLIGVAISERSGSDEAEAIATGVPWYEWIIDTPAPTPTRTPFTACIDSATPVNPALVHAALSEIEAKLTRWGPYYLGWSDDAVVVNGCPAEMLTRGNDRRVHNYLREDQFQLFISVLPDFHERFGNKLYVEQKETFGMGHVFAEETTGLYVPNLDQKSLFEGIVDALGMIGALYYWTATPSPTAHTPP